MSILLSLYHLNKSLKYKILLAIQLFFIGYIYATVQPSLAQAKDFAIKVSWAFEENKGQVTGVDSSKVNFFYKKGGLTMFLLNGGIAYQFEKHHYPEGYHQTLSKKNNLDHFQVLDSLSKLISRETYRMDLELVGANQNCEIISEGKSTDYIQYYNHNVLDVHAYQKITYKNIYPNIDWVVYHSQDASSKLLDGSKNSQLVKYDFIVHPGGNPSDIKLKTHWTESTKINPDGSLSLSCSMGEIVENTPISFQDSVSILTSFKQNGDIIQFQVGNFNPNQDLFIDPSIIWATYYGGSANDFGLGCTLDAVHNVYLCGYTSSFTGISSGGFQNTLVGGLNDAFLVKFNSSGSRIWATYYGGGNSQDLGYSCTVDVANNVYLCGQTNSTSGISSGGFQNTLAGPSDAFLVKFNSSGSRLWATYYGGNTSENGVSCTTDTANNVYLSGSTGSTSGISNGGFQNSFGGNWDVFLVKFNSAGSRLWATYYGGGGADFSYNCITDFSNNVYLCGRTSSTTGISSGGFQNTFGGSNDGFLVKFNSSGSRLWATYYGGSAIEDGLNCTKDTANNVYLSGGTASTSGISNGGVQNSFGGGSNDGFLVKFNSSGSRLWATYYGGSGTDGSESCITDIANNIYLYGLTTSTSGISSNGFQNTIGGGFDAFLVKFSSSGSRLWGSYYGGTGDEVSNSMAISSSNSIYFVGYTNSTSSIASNGFQNSLGGAQDAFLVKVADSVIPSIVIYKNKADSICNGTSVLFFDTIENGGTSPKFKWYKNNVLVDTNATCTSSNLNNGDSVYCVLTSNHPLRTKDTVWSNRIKIFVKPISNTAIYDTICSNQSKWFNGSNRTTTGIYLDTLVNSMGCDSFLSLNLLVKPISNRIVFDTVCSNQPYSFNGLNIITSGTYYDTLINAKGCDSFLTLELIIKPISSNTIFDTVCSNVSYVFNGVNRNVSGTYFDTLINKQGCDSFLTLNLVVKSTSSHTFYDTICSNQSKMFNGIWRTNAGVYLDTLINLKGCDSFIDMHLFVKSATTGVRYDTICHNHLMHFNGQNIGTAGTYLDTLTNSQGCDSFLTMNLSVRPLSNGVINQSICTGYTYFFNGISRSVAGAYQDTLLNSNGCDSFLTLNLTVKSTDTHNIFQVICEPQSYFFNNQNLTTSGTYRDTFTSSQGCDSFVFLYLNVKDTSLHEFTYVSPCDSLSYMFDGILRTMQGRYITLDTNVLGCDSTTILNLFFRKPTHTRLSPIQICPGSSYIFDGITRDTAGDYVRYYTNTDGCPSTDSLRISILNNPSPKTNPISACAPFTFRGITYSTSATIIDTIKSIVGNCDSVFLSNLIQLKPTATTAPEINHIVCDSIRLNNRLYTTSFSFMDTFRTVGTVCDSVYRKTNYIIRYTPQIGLKECDTFMRGSQVTLRSFSATNYLWSTGQTTRDISFKLTEDRQLYLIAWNEEPCRDTAYISLVAEEMAIVSVPTGFSPTGEHLENRTLRPNINGRLEYFHMMIFNRWGEKVYETFDPQPIGWNGIFKGEPAPAGLYGYIMEYKTLGSIFTKTGEVMLVR